MEWEGQWGWYIYKVGGAVMMGWMWEEWSSANGRGSECGIWSGRGSGVVLELVGKK